MDILTSAIPPSERHESGLKDFKLLGKLWPYMRPYKKSLTLSFLLLPLISGAEMGQTLLIRAAIDGPIKAGQLTQLGWYALSFLALLALNYRVRYIQMAESQKTGQRIIRDLRTDLYRHYQTLSPRFYQKHPMGKLVTRLTSDIENLSEMLSSGGLAILADLAMIVGALVGMLVMSWDLALATVVTMTLLLVFMEYFRSRSRQAYDEIRVKAARINAFLQENFSGMEIVQLYRREKTNYQHFETLNHSNLQSGLNSIFYSTSFNAVVEFMTTLTLVLILWLGGLRLLAGTLTIGTLVGFFMFVRKMFEPVEDVSEKYSILQSGLSSIDKVMALFQEKPDLLPAPTQTSKAVLPEPSTISQSALAEGAIAFDQVTFGYNADHPILKNLNFTIHRGEKIAIVGPSGAGKTTLIKLLMRFYDVDQGAILLNGTDLRAWPLTALRRNIVTIQQDDFLFSRSIAENIALEPYTPGMEDALRNAAIKSNALSFIERLSKGFETELEERGKNLSAGERQLLLFARAIYHDPTILILDEATSAIDPVTEQLVQEALETLMAERTVLIIAHRLATIQKADRIFVMEQGQIVQQGSHTTLIGQPGVYREFYEYQALLKENIERVSKN